MVAMIDGLHRAQFTPHSHLRDRQPRQFDAFTAESQYGQSQSAHWEILRLVLLVLIELTRQIRQEIVITQFELYR